MDSSQAASQLGKLSHQKSPRPKEFYSQIGKKGGRPKGYKPEKKNKLK